MSKVGFNRSTLYVRMGRYRHRQGHGAMVSQPQCEFTFRALFSRIIQPAHRLFVYQLFYLFNLFRRTQGRFFVCDGFSRKNGRVVVVVHECGEATWCPFHKRFIIFFNFSTRFNSHFYLKCIHSVQNK